MVTLLFGTVLPELSKFLIFDHDDIKRLIIVEELEFAFMMLSYGFLVTSILASIECYYKKL
jgi:hypothetical protein